jgi:hypothetical protein
MTTWQLIRFIGDHLYGAFTIKSQIMMSRTLTKSNDR